MILTRELAHELLVHFAEKEMIIGEFFGLATGANFTGLITDI
jgi:hypothetical protein